MFNFIKKYKITIFIAAAAVAALVVAFCTGGNVEDVINSPKVNRTVATFDSVPIEHEMTETLEVTTVSVLKEDTQPATDKNESTTEPEQQATEQNNSSVKETLAPITETQEPKPTDKYKTDPIPPGKPMPVEPQEQTTEDTRITCTFSISCATILDNMDDLDPEKVELVPKDGWILKPTKVDFYEGESIYDILVRICKDNKIHMQARFTPMYNSVYIEGISNLYEFDCGGQSGWMYCVNDWFPNYGCSRYVVKNGDTVEFKYTCNLGYDVGGGYFNGEWS